ncbi:gluconate 2-dehydrogenase subunit 3 family protein [Azospirillum sp. TSO22-1]|uniref:gluconate 2-dehydrogenase subunit 3 family protein n=1 Tax=Azospirillum sp. TSO22-1 TaxID=716789 RepID=UPI000D61486F|nr:gluconate 2-dehydrogenase subunit 3 family protein [Azospirillum sp. TSO22-1]PWC41904.1 Twin-arginine translocation pathway signal [Azospirillum sp. TSO22-1]
MRTIDKRSRLSRRSFLKTSAATAAGVGAVSGGMVVFHAHDAWAQSMTAITPEAAQVLLVMTRDVYPHDRLADSHYARAVETIDAGAAKDPKVATLINGGVLQLNGMATKKYDKSYRDLASETDRVALLKAIETTPFFQKIRGDMVTALYNQPEVWVKLGYEGPSADKGGYLHRGFNDLDWIKDA